jgi:hypothetical protein
MAKFKAPDNFGGLTVGDQTYTADKKGFVKLPNDFPTDLAVSHGLTPADAAQDTPDAPAVPDAPADAPAATIQPTGS